MADETLALHQLVARDERYPIEAYFFVRDALSYASDSLELNNQFHQESELYDSPQEHHLTGQQLCEAIREYALNQFGYMARIVLKNWGNRDHIWLWRHRLQHDRNWSDEKIGTGPTRTF